MRVDTGSIRVVVIVLVRVVVAARSHIVNVPAAQGTGSAGVGELVLQVHHGAMVVFGPLEAGGLGQEDGGLAARPVEKMTGLSGSPRDTARTDSGRVTGDMPYILRRDRSPRVDEDDVFRNKSPRSSGDRVAT